MNEHRRIDNRHRVARRRQVLRARGLRPKQFWLPDVTTLLFVAQAEADAAAIAASEESREVQAFLNSIIEEHWSMMDGD